MPGSQRRITPDICWHKLTSLTLTPFDKAYRRIRGHGCKTPADTKEGRLLLARAYVQPSCIPFPFSCPVFEGNALKCHFYSLGSCIPVNLAIQCSEFTNLFR